jgi:2-dehydropantoate 2-reductase
MAANPSPEHRMTVAVVGLGSIGGIVAGCLRDVDRHDVIACVRAPLERLVVERPEGTVDLPLRALTDPAAAARVDWVLLCTKTHQTASAAPWLKRLCDRETKVAALQNGIGHAEQIGPMVGGAAVMPVIVYYNGERLAPDRVRLRHAGPNDLVVEDNAGGRAFAQLLEGTPLKVLLSGDFATLLWRKLLINVIANPITALTLQRQAVFRRPDVDALCRAILDEAIVVARADGAKLAGDETERIMATLLTFPPEAGTSMYFDRLAGRPLEIEALTGAVVAAGERYGIATPLNRAMLTLVRAVSDAAKA